MPANAQSLRERKKERTRRTIRNEAFRLFREQGYVETTIEQIAAAAEISPSTFFRYFPSKEQLTLADDLDPIMIEAFERQPKDLSVFAAFRRATVEVFQSLTPEEAEFEAQRQQLIESVPELRGAMAQEFDRTVLMMADLIARRTGRKPDDFEVRVTSGAVIGAFFAMQDLYPVVDQTRIMRVFDFIEAGMPL